MVQPKQDYYPDGNYEYAQIANALDNDFVNEKELVKYLESHMEEFCIDFLGVEYKAHKREFLLTAKNSNKKHNRRIDFLIESKCGQRIAIECKNPTAAGSELTAGVGQVLGYVCLCEAMEINVNRFVLLSTKIDPVTIMIINKFNLPIEFYATDKNKHLKFVRSDRK